MRAPVIEGTPDTMAIGAEFHAIEPDEVEPIYRKACRFISTVLHDSHRIEIRRTTTRLEYGNVVVRGRRRSSLVDPVEMFPLDGSDAGREFFGMLAGESGPTRPGAAFELVEIAVAQPVNGSLLAEDGSPTREATPSDVAFASGVWIEARNFYGLRESDDGHTLQRIVDAISPTWIELRADAVMAFSRFHEMTSFETWRTEASNRIAKVARIAEPFRVKHEHPVIAPRSFDPTGAFPLPGLPFIP